MHTVSQESRLRNSYEFAAVFGANNKIRSRQFLLYFNANSLLSSRLGVIVAKKIVSKAVWRNKIKRMIREYFRMHLLEGLDVVIVVIKNIEPVDRFELQKQLDELWHLLIKHSQ